MPSASVGSPTNANFIDDVQIELVRVQGPTQLTVTVSTANSTVSAGAITVTTGLNVIEQALGYQVIAADPLQSSN